MKVIKKIIKNPLFWIFIIAIILRIYKLGVFPYGFHEDEAKVAWNTLSILKTGRDDQGGLLSLYYNSFGDYRPTGIFYFTIPSITIFGRTEFATRFPVALFGALTIFPLYFLVEILNRDKKHKKRSINTALLAGFLLAISPWHIELSRATNEVVISTFFAISSLFFFIKLIKTGNKKFGIFTILSILISYLLYHSIRFLGPLFFVILFLWFLKEIRHKKNKTWIWTCIITTFLLTIFFSVGKAGLARLNEVSIFNNPDTSYEIQRIKTEDLTKSRLTFFVDNKLVVYFKKFADEYAGYFTGDFLIGSGAKPYRFTTPGTGIITYIETVLLIVGLIEIIKGKRNLLPLLLLLAAPLPAALTTEDSPNLSRAFLMLPFFIFIEAYGLERIFQFSRKYKERIKIGILTLLILNFSYFLYMYFNHSINHQPFVSNYFVDSPTYRDVGALELSLKIDSLKTKYDKIIITDFPDSIYPWYAFFTGKDPTDFNKTYKDSTNERDYGNIIFSEEKCPSDENPLKYGKQKILIVDSWECPYQSQIRDGSPLKVVEKITRSDGSEVYALLEYN